MSVKAVEEDPTLRDEVRVVLSWTSSLDGARVLEAVLPYCDRFDELVDRATSTHRTYAPSADFFFTIAFGTQDVSLVADGASLGEPLLRAIFDDLALLVLRTLSRSAIGPVEAIITYYRDGAIAETIAVPLPTDTTALVLDFTSDNDWVRDRVDDAVQTFGTDERGRVIFDESPTPSVSEAVDTVRVFYATDRAPERIAGVPTYGANRAGLSYGYCNVDLPRMRLIGQVKPSLLRRIVLRTRPDARLDVHAPIPVDRDKFATLLGERMDGRPRKQVLVFIHGYNVPFETAIGRAAQMQADIGFDGPTVVYSWPSRGKTRAYFLDGAAVEAARHHLVQLLREVITRTGATDVHLIAHSMGNRAATRALEQLAPDLRDSSPICQVVLAAPDVDAAEMEHMLPVLKLVAKRITLYGSSKDKPLALAEWLAGWRRAGDGGENLLCAPSFADCIDATAIDTAYLAHSYAMDNPALLNDIKSLIDDDKPPALRFGLTANENGTWAFRGRQYQ